MCCSYDLAVSLVMDALLRMYRFNLTLFLCFSSAIVNASPSQSSSSLYSTEVISPTPYPPTLYSAISSIQKSPVASIFQSSVSSTTRPVPELTSMTSSINLTSTSIKASPTTSEALPSSTVSVVVDKLKELEEGRLDWMLFVVAIHSIC